MSTAAAIFNRANIVFLLKAERGLGELTAASRAARVWSRVCVDGPSTMGVRCNAAVAWVRMLPRPMNEETDRINRNPQRLGDLLVATILNAVKAECLSLLGCNAPERQTKLAG